MERRKGGIDEISQKTGLSRSTVSKALNNCGSVSSDTKQSVLEAARALRYVPARRKRVQRRDGQWLVAAVMPETPAYFWGEAARGMKSAAERHPELRMASSLFSRLSAGEDLLYCIDYALDLQPDLMIVTPSLGAEVARKLATAAESLPVVCFNETADFDYLFYVGADFYGDGAALAREAGGLLRTRPRVLRIGSMGLPMTSRRDEGFRRTLMNLAPEAALAGTIDVSALSSALLPAQLAREIHEKYDGAFDAVYVSQGCLPQVLSALDKLKCPPDIPVFGYERGGQETQGRTVIVLEQDTFGQGAQCVEAVWRYLESDELPEGGALYTPSRLRRA